MTKPFKVIRSAYQNDALTKLIFEIRQKVFVDEQMVSRDEEFDRYESTSIHYLGYYNDRPVATARWRITEKGIKLERFAVEREYRGVGAGWAVLSQVLEDVACTGQYIYLHAQVSAIGFYEKAGFKKEGPMFTEANIDHYRMTYPLNQDTDH
jgi:predicted GNAT family N-acyltransferase